jgi:hypothetical protein
VVTEGMGLSYLERQTHIVRGFRQNASPPAE